MNFDILYEKSCSEMSKLLIFQIDGSKSELFYNEVLSVAEKYGIVTEFHANQERVLRRGDLLLDSSKMIAIRNTEIVELTYREFMCLYYLAAQPGIVFQTNYLYELVWEEKKFIGRTSSVTSLVSKIRQKLKDNSRNPKYILTVRDIGYRFNPNIEGW